MNDHIPATAPPPELPPRTRSRKHTVLAVVLSTFVMAFAAKPLADFIERQPTIKMLALAFILLIGVALVADGLGFHIPRGYLYFAIAFSLAVELLNLRTRKSEGGK